MTSDVNSTLNTKSETTGQIATDRRNYGDIRDDGFVFINYRKDGREKWESPKSHTRRMLRRTIYNTKRRAREKNLPHNLTVEYLLAIWPSYDMCPVFGITMTFGSDGTKGCTGNSPSLDRIIPDLGYVEGNVIWVSSKANWMKSCGTVEELFTVAQFYQRLLHNPSLFLPGDTTIH